MSYEAKAREWRDKGDKKLRSFGFFGNKYEEAADAYEKAANQFKLAKLWQEAAETYTKLAEVHIKLESRHDAASAWVEAAKAYTKVDQRQAVTCLQQAVSLYTDMGRLGMAARQLKEIGEVLEKEGNKEEAIMFFEQASDLYATENSSAEASKCNLKVAQYSAELEQYDRAAQLYEGVARLSVDNNLLKYSAKGYLLNAGICLMCGAGALAVQTAIDRYKDLDVSFDGSREAKLLEDLAGALEAGDAEAFTSHIAEFDSITRLDPWRTTMLVRVKRRITSRQAVDEEDLT